MAFTARFILRAVASLALLVSTACGFKPLYAVDAESGPQSLANMHLSGVTGDEGAKVAVIEAFRYRKAQQPSTARYDLKIRADEAAAPLAVQIDASVTRFNYRLIGKYTLKDRETGQVLNGSTTAIASFNVINSQYATLNAERDARRKAANMLADQIEREILLRLAAPKKVPKKNPTEDVIDGPDIVEESAPTDEGVELISDPFGDLEDPDLYLDQPVDPDLR